MTPATINIIITIANVLLALLMLLLYLLAHRDYRRAQAQRAAAPAPTSSTVCKLCNHAAAIHLATGKCMIPTCSCTHFAPHVPRSGESK